MRTLRVDVGHVDMSITGDTNTHVVIDPWDDEWARTTDGSCRL